MFLTLVHELKCETNLILSAI